MNLDITRWNIVCIEHNQMSVKDHDMLHRRLTSKTGQQFRCADQQNSHLIISASPSFLSVVLFIGIIPLLFLMVLLIRTFIKFKYNTEFVLVSLYLITNMFKNDSINYLVVFVFYGVVFLILQNNIRKNLFTKPLVDRNIQNWE